jgi:excisionase family DNA binding protein
MGPPKRSPDDLLTTAEAAKLAKKKARTMRQHAERGNIPARRIGRDWLFRRGDVEAFRPRKPGRPSEATP